MNHKNFIKNGFEIIKFRKNDADFLRKKIFPTQILIEYTNIRSLNILKHLEIFLIDLQLRKNNYNLVFQNKKGDFTYLYKEKI